MKKYLVSITIAFLVSCSTSIKKENPIESPKVSSTSNTPSKSVIKPKNNKELIKKQKEKEKLEKLHYYVNNPSVTDENGIKYNLSIKSKIVSKNALYTSNKIHYEYRYDKFYVLVKSYKITTLFEFYANGELKDEINLQGYLLESKRSDKNDYGTFCSDSYTYYPKLENESTRKRKVAKFTGVNCGLGTDINNQVRNARIKAVKSCGILEGK